jgi:hypothetical protein
MLLIFGFWMILSALFFNRVKKLFEENSNRHLVSVIFLSLSCFCFVKALIALASAVLG